MKLYIEVKKHGATNTKGARISAEIKGRGRKYFPYNFALDAGANLRAAGYAYAYALLADAGHNMAEPVLAEYVSTKNGLPVGYVWEG